jgi:hypothetical protein
LLDARGRSKDIQNALRLLLLDTAWKISREF